MEGQGARIPDTNSTDEPQTNLSVGGPLSSAVWRSTCSNPAEPARVLGVQPHPLRIAFGSDPTARKGIKVKSIKKPPTVTFSNGKSVDVGLRPEIGYNVCHFGILIPFMIWYICLVRRHGPEWFRSGKWLRPGKSITED